MACKEELCYHPKDNESNPGKDEWFFSSQ